MNYSLKHVIRNIPLPLLQTYLQSRNIPKTSIQWNTPEERLTDEIYSVLENKPDIKATVDQELKLIHELGDEAGYICLLDIARCVYKNDTKIIEATDPLAGYEAKALWIYLNQRDVYEGALRVESIETMSNWSDCVVGKDLTCDTEEETVAELEKQIRHIFKKEDRGRSCQIDVYIRENPQRYCFFAYPENHSTRGLTYRGTQMITQISRPPMEVVMIYDPQSGLLKVHAGKTRKADELQEAFCKTALGLKGIPDKSTMVYELKNLMNPQFRFTHEPEDGIESVSLRMLMTDTLPGSQYQRITCEGDPENGGAELVQKMMRDALSPYRINPARIKIKKAKITIHFTKIAGVRKRSVTFVLTDPNGSTLEDNPQHKIAEKCIERWGLRRPLLDDQEATA